MSLPFLQLGQTLGSSCSAYTLSVVVLASSFVSPVYCYCTLANSKSQVSHICFRYLEPRSLLPLVTLLVVPPTLLSSPLSFHVRWPITLAFAAYGSLLVLFTLTYRLSPLHPLAKYPGPALAKTSKWWAAYLGGKGDLHRVGKDLHDRYGDIVRVG